MGSLDVPEIHPRTYAQTGMEDEEVSLRRINDLTINRGWTRLEDEGGEMVI